MKTITTKGRRADYSTRSPSCILVLLISIFAATLFTAHAQEGSWQYGTEMRLYLKSKKEPPATWSAALAELAGTYEGRGIFKGDRRFNSYERFYQIKVTVADPSSGISAVKIEWKSKTEKWDDNDGSTADLAKFSVKDAKTNGSKIWGTMHASVNGKDKGPQYSFLAIPSEKNGVKGLLLLGRYEGSVFLAKSD